MQFPLSFWDLGVWLAVNAVILLTTSEILSSHYGKSFKVDKKNLEVVAVLLGILFMIVVVALACNTLIARAS